MMLRFLYKTFDYGRCLGVVFLVLLIVAGCAAKPTPTDTPDFSQTPTASSNVVVAEGKVLPEQYASISFLQSGDIAEILVDEGAKLKKGDVIARIKDNESLYANLTLAEQNLVTAQQELDDVKKDEGVDRAKALQTIADSSDQLRKAQHQQYYYTVPSRVAIMGMFEAVDKTNEVAKDARKAYEPYKDDLIEGNGLSVSGATFCVPQYLCKGLKIQPSDDPARKLKDKLDDAEGDLSIAINQLIFTSNVDVAQATLEKAQKDYEKLKTGPDPDKLAIAEAKVKTAQFKVDEAKKDIADLELRAPFDGTVGKINFKVGESVQGGVPVVTMGNLSKWVVETDNLTEIQVVKLDVGQDVMIAADALPGKNLKGVVKSISDDYEDNDGDIVYTIKIDLTDPDPQIRWGMTVVATFDKQ